MPYIFISLLLINVGVNTAHSTKRSNLTNDLKKIAGAKATFKMCGCVLKFLINYTST